VVINDLSLSVIGARRGLARLRVAVDAAVDGTLVAALVSEAVIIFVATVSRKLLNHSFLWTQESASLALSVIAFLGGAVAYREGQALSVQAVLRLLPERGRRLAEAFGDSIVFLVSVMIAVFAYQAAFRNWPVLTTDERLPLGLFDIPLVVGACLFAFYAADRLIRQRALAVGVLAALGAGSVAAILTQPAWNSWSLSLGLSWTHYFWVSFILIAVLFALGLPIPFVLIVVPVIYFFVSRQVPTLVAEQQMTDATNNFLLLAIPFFVLAGLVMAHGGLGHRTADVVKLFLRRLPGGLQHSVIGFMYVFSGLSGSKVADMAAVGTTLGPELEAAGHRREDTTAVLAASAVMGESIPPSIALIVLGSVTPLSIGALFLGGIIPAALLAVLLSLAVVARSWGEHVRPAERVSWGTRGTTVLRAVPAIGLPVILVYGIVGGVGTPTEVSSFAVIYGVVAAVIYRSMSVRRLWTSCRDAAVLSGMIIFIISSAAVFSWFLNIEGFPTTLANLLGRDLGDRRWAFVLASVALLVVMGAFLEGIAAVLIFAPLLLPMAVSLGVDPLQYGIVLVVAMNLGYFTPPIGIGAYVACSIGRTTIEEFIKPFLLYWILLLAGIVVMAFWEWPSTFLPQLFHVK
jgi:tripartite ATP-independent transporter DctM subunit